MAQSMDSDLFDSLFFPEDMFGGDDAVLTPSGTALFVTFPAMHLKPNLVFIHPSLQHFF